MRVGREAAELVVATGALRVASAHTFRSPSASVLYRESNR